MLWYIFFFARNRFSIIVIYKLFNRFKKCEHASVAEAAVVPYPHEIFGEGIFAYVVLKDDFKLNDLELIKQLQSTVKSKIAHYAIPNKFQVNKFNFWFLRVAFKNIRFIQKK